MKDEMFGLTPQKGRVPHHFAVNDGDFKKSSYSDPGGVIKTCVEVAVNPQGVALRNSQDPTKNTVFFSCPEWDAFVEGVKNNEFDR